MIVPIALRSSNAYLVQSKRPLLVDTGTAADHSTLLRALEQARVNPAALALIVHTHAHPGHCGGTAALQSRYGIPAVLHRADKKLLAAEPKDGLPQYARQAKRYYPLPGRAAPGFRPEILFEAELDLDAFGLAAKLLPTPGHTAGSASLVFGSGEAIVGDLLKGGSLLDRAAHYPARLEDLGRLQASLQQLLDLGVRWFYAGHGGPFSRRQVERLLSSKAGPEDATLHFQ